MTQEIDIAHLSMIQEIVKRLESNALNLKIFAMILATVFLILTVMTENQNYRYALIGCFPVAVFWIMDAGYLRLGRLFRHLFNAVRLREVKSPFSMDIRPYIKKEQSVIRIAFSWSVAPFYISLIMALAGASSLFLTFC